MTLAGPTGKGPAAFRTISEASAELGVPQHVLRFWETRFTFIRPTKRAGGRRFYRPQDLAVLRGVRVLLQDEGYTIKGVQKLHKDQGLKRLVAASGVGEEAASRLAAQVEAEAVGPPPPATPDPGGAGPAPAPLDGEGSQAELDDLFGDIVPTTPEQAASERPLPERSDAAPTGPAADGHGRPVLDPTARARLVEVLSDLEATKAGIDALLGN